MSGSGRGLDALAGEVDDLRREIEGLRNTVDADVDALAHLLDETEVDGRPAGPIPSLRHSLDETRGHLHALADQITDLADDPRSASRLPSWTEMNAEQAEAAWNRLIRWMQRVLFVRYPPATEVVRDCWYRHPELVEHLSWLQVSWALAYHNPKTSISTAAEWHTRWLPAVLDRARAILRPCYLAHVDDSRVPPERYSGFGSDLADHVRADLRTRMQGHPCPSPSSPLATTHLTEPSTRTTPHPK